MPLLILALTGWLDGHSRFTGSSQAAPASAWASRATGGSVDQGSWSGSGAKAARRALATMNPRTTKATMTSRRRRTTLHSRRRLDGFRGACDHAEVMRPTTILLLM